VVQEHAAPTRLPLDGGWEAGAEDDLAPRPGIAHIAGDGVADAGAALATEHKSLGQGLGLDMQVPLLADRVKIAAGALAKSPTVIDGFVSENQVRTRLHAGGSRIRTIGSA
jgi:hypothetical protein